MHFRHPRPLLKAHLSIQSLIAISEYEYECDVVLFVVCVCVLRVHCALHRFQSYSNYQRNPKGNYYACMRRVNMRVWLLY